MFNADDFLRHLTNEPGVYQMLDAEEHVIYVGKAKNLKKRVSSYFRKQLDNPKTGVMVKKIANIRTIVTRSENEALILENNLIKQFRPRYNILFKDDKSFPYLFISDHNFPRLSFYRGNKKTKGDYFGPYPNSLAVRDTLKLLQKIFLLRNCNDNFFSHRSRPCLQYHIKRCSGPCVDLVSKEKYQQDVRHAKLFLQGKNQEVIDNLVSKMEEAAAQEAYEKAAFYRDQIRDLRQLIAEQTVEKGTANCDVMAIASYGKDLAVQVLMFRNGKLVGNKSFFPQSLDALDTSLAEVLESFVSQYYLTSEERQAPAFILTNQMLPNQAWLAAALSEKSKRSIVITQPVRGERASWLRLAEKNAKHDLVSLHKEKASVQNQIEDLCGLLDLPGKTALRLECFDISHTQGESTVASCVVFDEQGPRKADYRIFNIRDIQAGDDYDAMRQALKRRYQRAIKGEVALPDLLVIDGGKGQLSQAVGILKELGVNGVEILGIAKGPSRKAGLETLWLADCEQALDAVNHPLALKLLQYIRDEAHRFAITQHRKQRAKPRKESFLENIEGIGDQKRQALLKHFGGLIALKQASIEEIAKVKGIGMSLASKIYEFLH